MPKRQPPYSARARIIRWFVPNIPRRLKLPYGLQMTASLKQHVGLFRPSTLQREVAIAERLANYVRADGVIYDVGANIGLYTLLFGANRSRQVISFEPTHGAFAYLKLNVEQNQLNNITLHQVALSDRTGTCRFSLDEVTTATSHVCAPDEPGEDVPCADLDSYIEAAKLVPPEFVKIDVEGHDQAVLRGAGRTLGRFRPIVYVDGGERDLHGHVATMGVLRDMGYSIWDLKRERNLPPDSVEYSFLAMP